MHAWGKTSYRALRPAFALRNSVRTSRALGLPVYLLPATGCRHAAQNSLGATNASTTRKQVTVTGDDGRVRWGELSNREKAARTTQQSFNFLTILTGIVLTGGVITFLYLDVFSPDSKTNHFNRAVNQLRKDPQCIELLGNGKQIKAYGEPSGNKWSRNRPIASKIEIDRAGTEHLLMHFNVDGPLNSGVVNIHMTKSRSQSEFVYKYLALDVKGHTRIYLENADAKPDSSNPARRKMFGVKWW